MTVAVKHHVRRLRQSNSMHIMLQFTTALCGVTLVLTNPIYIPTPVFPPPYITVVKEERVYPVNGHFKSYFLTSDGTEVALEGNRKPSGHQEIKGNFSYIQDDGTRAELVFVADERGYQPSSSLLPVGPPPPPHALFLIEKARREHEQQNSSEDIPIFYEDPKHEEFATTSTEFTKSTVETSVGNNSLEKVTAKEEVTNVGSVDLHQSQPSFSFSEIPLQVISLEEDKLSNAVDLHQPSTLDEHSFIGPSLQENTAGNFIDFPEPSTELTESPLSITAPPDVTFDEKLVSEIDFHEKENFPHKQVTVSHDDLEVVTENIALDSNTQFSAVTERIDVSEGNVIPNFHQIVDHELLSTERLDFVSRSELFVDTHPVLSKIDISSERSQETKLPSDLSLDNLRVNEPLSFSGRILPLFNRIIESDVTTLPPSEENEPDAIGDVLDTLTLRDEDSTDTPTDATVGAPTEPVHAQGDVHAVIPVDSLADVRSDASTDLSVQAPVDVEDSFDTPTDSLTDVPVQAAVEDSFDTPTDALTEALPDVSILATDGDSTDAPAGAPDNFPTVDLTYTPTEAPQVPSELNFEPPAGNSVYVINSADFSDDILTVDSDDAVTEALVDAATDSPRLTEQHDAQNFIIFTGTVLANNSEETIPIQSGNSADEIFSADDSITESEDFPTLRQQLTAPAGDGTLTASSSESQTTDAPTFEEPAFSSTEDTTPAPGQRPGLLEQIYSFPAPR